VVTYPSDIALDPVTNLISHNPMKNESGVFMPDSALPPTVIDYYTDMLCVWAWIAQPRLEELQRQWHHKVEVRHRYVDIFGDSHTKIALRWGQHDGFDKFSAHVIASAAPFKDTPIHAAIWKQVRPYSSMPAHLLLKTIGLVYGDAMVQAMSVRIRRAFFVDARDIGQLGLLLDLAEDLKLDSAELNNRLMDGRAMAALSADQQSARELGIKGSPTWVLNEGRQILYGNVGYRILNANIEELLKRPAAEASWC
jgi:predicted DsbA family dithiol-disulfide isomerase